MQAKYFRNASGQLTLEIEDSAASEYIAIRDSIVAEFNLEPCGELIQSIEVVFQKFRLGDAVLNIRWDCWGGFSVGSEGSEAEELTKRIGEYLEQSVESLVEKPEEGGMVRRVTRAVKAAISNIRGHF